MQFTQPTSASNDISFLRGKYFTTGEYEKAISFYQNAIEESPEILENYWYLGLAQLLQGKEVDAQATWFVGIADNEEKLEAKTVELVQVLKREADFREESEDFTIAWVIRQHIRELIPDDFDNLLKIICCDIQKDSFDENSLFDYHIIDTLNSDHISNVDLEFLVHFIKLILDTVPLSPAALELTKACARWAEYMPTFADTVLVASIHIAYSVKCPQRAIELADICLRLKPDNPEVLRQLAAFCQNAGDFSRGISLAKQCYNLLSKTVEKIFASHLVFRGLLSAGGHWKEASEVLISHNALINQLIEEQPKNLDTTTTLRLLASTYFLPYLQDDLIHHRFFHNQIAKIAQDNLQESFSSLVEIFKNRQYLKRQEKQVNRPIRIGYISHCLRRHSVGWLARWLFEHHNRDKFELYAYLFGAKDVNDSILEWYVSQVHKAYRFPLEGIDAAKQISVDNIDILVDLDSITLDITCEVMALKPADIQVTWLGWDASGLETIDYFIADPYVLPDWADEHYQEKIWRLPQTYIGVDGFEVGIPTLRRDQLDVPDDAVLYLTGQKGYKRHPDTVKLQLKIIKEVPNSCLLVKGLADEDSIQQLFNQMAVEEGVDPSRLRFLPEVALEAVHRANLGIADIVLDTYPYNGATTTLETLWMCIPMVTRVGEQFAARNSYTMMINAGIQEGIAWTDEEYVEWGIKLGKDAKLRQDIAWRLKQSRQTAPLWNGKQFTREMEAAYEQMWQKYITSETSSDVT